MKHTRPLGSITSLCGSGDREHQVLHLKTDLSSYRAQDDEKNWVTTSMKNNSIKSNYTIEELRWTLYPKGDITEWDGLTYVFIKLVDKDPGLLKDSYIRNWYNVSKKCLRVEICD